MRLRSSFILLLPALAVIAMTVGWAFLAHPALDDFCLANLSGVSEAVSTYQTWSGRWAAFLGYGAFFAGSTFPNYWLWIVIGLAMWWGGFVVALKDKRLGTIAFALFVSGMPSQAEGLFFATNVLAYTLPFLLAVVAFRVPWWAALPCAFLVSGFSEWIGAFVLALALVRKDWRLAGAAFVGLAVNLVAPGNFARAGIFKPSFPLAVVHTIKNYDSVLAFVADPRLILFTAFLLARPKREVEFKALPAVAAVSLAGIFALAFTLGGPAPGRVLNIAYASIAIGWALFGLSSPWRIELTRPMRQALAVVLGLSMLTSSNMGAMVRDMPEALAGEHSAPLLDAGGVPWADKCIREREAETSR